jgi:hypothetical protein
MVDDMLLTTVDEAELRGITLGEARGMALGEVRGMALGKSEGLAQGIAQVLDLLKSGKPPRPQGVDQTMRPAVAFVIPLY